MFEKNLCSVTKTPCSKKSQQAIREISIFAEKRLAYEARFLVIYRAVVPPAVEREALV